MKRPSPFQLALREWKALEKQCADAARTGGAFLTDDAGELRLFESRPALTFVFGRAWEARRKLERIAHEQGVTPPPLGISAQYTEWPSLDALSEFFLILMGEPWEAMRRDYFIDHDQVQRIAPPPPTGA